MEHPFAMAPPAPVVPPVALVPPVAFTPPVAEVPPVVTAPLVRMPPVPMPCERQLWRAAAFHGQASTCLRLWPNGRAGALSALRRLPIAGWQSSQDRNFADADLTDRVCIL
jgi:hypothetical protein